MATAVVTLAPMAPSEPGPPAKSFKRMIRTSLQETMRHVRSKDKEATTTTANKGRHGQAAPPSAFMDYISRPSLFRRSLETERKEPSEDGRQSTTPSVSSATPSGAERRPRVLRKQNNRAPPPPPPPPNPPPDKSSADNHPPWGAFIPPTLSRGSMSSPALHTLRDDPSVPHRSPLASITALFPHRVRKQSLVLPPKSTVTPTPHFEAPTKASNSKTRQPISRPKQMLAAAPSIPPRSPSRALPPVNGNGHLPSPSSSPKGSRIILGMGHPSTSSRRLPGASASSSHLPISVPPLESPKKSPVEKSRPSLEADGGHTPRPARRPSIDAPTRPSLDSGSQSPLPRRTSTDVRKPSSSDARRPSRQPSVDSGRPSRQPSLDSGRPSTDTRRPSTDTARRPSMDQGAATPRATSPRPVPPSPTTPPARSPSTTRASSPSPHTPARPTRLGRGIGSASTSHLPLSHPSRSSSPTSSSSVPTATRLMSSRPSHSHSNSVPVTFPSSADEQRSASPAMTATSATTAPPSPSLTSSSVGFIPGHRAKAASLDTTSSVSPQRDLVRRAGRVLVTELVDRRNHNVWVVKDMAEELDKRLNALGRIVKMYGKSPGGEERERKSFAEAVKDGYVLCHFVNKLRPGCILRIAPGSQTNVTKFIAAAAEFGLSAEELCEKDDFKALLMEHLAHIARTILAVAHAAENPPPRKFVSGAVASSSSSSSIYGSGASSMSTPNLLRSASPPSVVIKKQRRFSPPGPMLPTLRSASPTDDADVAGKEHNSPVVVVVDEEDVFGPKEYNITTDLPSSPQSRANPRLSTTSRTSVASSDATTAYSSLLDPRSSTRFGTVRTMMTEATSLSATTDRPSLTPTEASSAKAVLLATGEYDASLPSVSASRRSMPSSPVDGEGPRRRHADRRMSDDLARVAEETDEGGGTVPRNPPPEQQHPNVKINVGKGKWPDDFMEAFKPTSPKSRKLAPIKIPPPDGGGGGAEEVSLDSPTLASWQEEETVASKMGSNSRPIRIRRTSVDRNELAPSPQPITPTSAGIRVRRRSTRTSSDILLPKEGEPSPLPSEVAGGGSGELAPRRRVSSSTTKNRGPRTKSEERLGREGPVPFPRSLPGGGLSSPSGPAAPHRSSGSEDTVKEEAEVEVENTASSSKLGPPLPLNARARFEKERRSSFGDQQLKAGVPQLVSRPRHESMMNMGASTSKGDRGGLIGGMDGSAVRKTLVVKEEGKPSVHYQLGNCIGRGQFGSVYRALNLNSGQTVAVKRIRLEGLSEKEIEQLMHEVEIVKRLSHPSIVKYEGMARDSDTLSIVLEYAENGSLAQTLKAFGKLNENLVASYVTKVLEGLHYLHSSEVVHCDLKSANILTTKTGNVKLSDFGVSLNLRAMEQIKNDVAGTPNWMAPEVIELKGASPASDIWSLACTIIELLTGAPPYADIPNSMSVMFKIVEDDMPPIPSGLSEPLQDFLKQCFNKDPVHRPDAVQLFEHPWLKNEWGLLQELRPHDSIPFLRRVSAEVQRSDVRSLQFVDEDRPSSPRSITSMTGAASAEGPPRPHDFVKSQFSQAVTCRVCNNPGKKSIMFCKQCNLIAHLKCVPDAPEDCEDVEARVIRLSLDLQRDAHFRQSSPSPLAARSRNPSSPSRQTSPIPIARQAKTPSSPLGGSPMNGATHPPPAPAIPPTTDNKPGGFRIFSKKKSKASSLAGAASNESLRNQTTTTLQNNMGPSPPVAYIKYDDNAKPAMRRMPRTRSSEDETFMTTRSRRSRHSTSIRSRESISPEEEGSQLATAAQRASTVESELSRASRMTDPGDLAAAAVAGEEAYRKRRGSGRRDTESDGSRCIVQ